MWSWITDYSVWILMVAGVMLAILLLFKERIQELIISKAPDALKDRAKKKAGTVFWTVEGIILGIITVAFVAITLSRTGIGTMITPQTVEEWFLEHGTSILIILVLGIFFWYMLKKFLPLSLARVMKKPSRGESREGMKRRKDTLVGVFMGLGKVIIALSVIFMVLSELAVPIGPMLAGLGVVGIAVGFGAQYLIRDLIAGTFILIENQYRVGDVAKVADIWGLVEEVNLRKTVLRDLDGAVHHVPNGEIRVASNYSRHFARVNLNISVAYGTDLDFAIGVINRVCHEMAEAEEWSKAIKLVPQVLRVDKLGDSGIDIKILGEVKPLEQWRVTGELRLRLKKAFDAEGIEIPWPHTKVYFGNSPDDEKQRPRP
ncbi:mechanosensitive ion channel family protein [Chloroflexota bacterium]